MQKKRRFPRNGFEKRWFLVGVVLSLMSLVVLGCGIPKENYAAMVAERDTAQSQVNSQQAQIQTLQGDLDGAKTDLTAAQSKIGTLESDLNKSQEQIKSLQSSVSSAQSQLSTFKSDLNSSWTAYGKNAELGEYLLRYWAAAARGDEATLTTMTLDMVKYVDAVGDTELSQLWKDFLKYVGEGKGTEGMQCFSQLMLKNIELAEKDAQAINARLSR